MMDQMDLDPRYIQYIHYFNEGNYGDAHRTLAEAWQLNIQDTFYKGLIQLAGAFEHWHDGSLFWAEDLLASAHNLLQNYAPECDGLDVDALLDDIRACHQVAIEARARSKNKSSDANNGQATDESTDSTIEKMPVIRLKLKSA